MNFDCKIIKKFFLAVYFLCASNGFTDGVDIVFQHNNQRATKYNQPLAEVTDDPMDLGKLGGHTNTINNVLTNPKNVVQTRTATAQEKEKMLKAVISTVIIYQGNWPSAEVSGYSKNPISDAIDSILFKHFEIIRSVAHLSFMGSKIIAETPSLDKEEILSKIRNFKNDFGIPDYINIMTSYGSISENTFIQWFWDTYNAHKSGTEKRAEKKAKQSKAIHEKTPSQTISTPRVKSLAAALLSSPIFKQASQAQNLVPTLTSTAVKPFSPLPTRTSSEESPTATTSTTQRVDHSKSSTILFANTSDELKKKLAQKFGNISASIKSTEFDNTSTTNVFKSPLKPRLVRGTVHSTLPLPFKTPKKDEVKGEATKQNEALQL